MTYTFDPAAAGGGTKTLTYDYTDTNGLFRLCIRMISLLHHLLPPLSTTPADLCIDAGTQTGLGGGTPTGGVYSGPGVTDDGNGMTYSFNPASAGAGIHTLMYTVTDGMGGFGNASDDVEVFSLPVVSFTAPVDMCENEPSAGQSGGNPTGGVFSGPGVTDLGNGSAYAFDPASAGPGVHTITYTYTDISTGCVNAASDDIEIFAVPTVSFTALADLCLTDGVQTGLGGGNPSGGTYSGSGVTDDGNGMTYSFDPLVAGTGTRTITYSVPGGNGCFGEATDEVVVSSCGGTITWDGSVSSDWNTPGNWDGNQVPTANDDVVIPEVVTNNPVITNGVDGQAQSLTISANGYLTIANNGSLTVSSETDPISVDASGLLTIDTGGELDASITPP